VNATVPKDEVKLRGARLWDIGLLRPGHGEPEIELSGAP
jgi:hypothetical protein